MRLPDEATIDHIIPRVRGGSDEDSNVVSACHACNYRRNQEDIQGLPDGSLLPDDDKRRRSGTQSEMFPDIALKDKVIRKLMADRDRAVRRSLDYEADLIKTSHELYKAKDEARELSALVESQAEEIQSLTVRGLLKERLTGLYQHCITRLGLSA